MAVPFGRVYCAAAKVKDNREGRINYAKKGYMDKELEAVKTISFQTGQGEVLFTKKEYPVRELKDVEGVKLFASTPMVQARVKLWGGMPVALPFTELYGALHKGIIEGIMLSYNTIEIFKLDDFLKYATFPVYGSVCSAFIMNKRTFSKLPPEGKAFVNDENVSMKYALMFGKAWDQNCDAGQDIFLKAGGKELQWEGSALKEMAELEAPLWEEWIADKEKRGLPGRQAVDDLYYIFEGLGVKPAANSYKPAK